MKLIVTCRELRYAGQTLVTGALFDASDKDAKLLKAIKKAAEAPADPVPVRHAATVRPVFTAAVEAEPAVEPEAETDAEAEPARRSYRRRDIQAEE